MSISPNTNDFWLLLFLQQCHQPQRGSDPEVSIHDVAFHILVIRAHTVGNYAPLIIKI